jgi:hypothetical protein
MHPAQAQRAFSPGVKLHQEPGQLFAIRGISTESWLGLVEMGRGPNRR